MDDTKDVIGAYVRELLHYLDDDVDCELALPFACTEFDGCRSSHAKQSSWTNVALPMLTQRGGGFLSSFNDWYSKPFKAYWARSMRAKNSGVFSCK